MTIHHIFDRTFAAPDTRGTSRCMDRQLSNAEALKYFVSSELGYGSDMKEITPTQIRTESSCLGTTDKMVFSGSEEDMALLVEMASVYQGLCKGEGTLVTFTGSRDWNFNREASLFLSALASAERPALATLWYMVAKKGGQPDDKMKRGDVFVAFELIYIDNQDPKDVFELSGIQYKH